MKIRLQSHSFCIRISDDELLHLYEKGWLEQEFPFHPEQNLKLKLLKVSTGNFFMQFDSAHWLIHIPDTALLQWIENSRMLGLRYPLKADHEQKFDFILERDVHSGSSGKKKNPEHAYLSFN